MPASPSGSTPRTRSNRQGRQENDASNSTQQPPNEPSDAAATIATTTAAPATPARRTHADGRKRKNRQSPTDPNTKGPANTPKRSKSLPSVNAEAVQERLDRALTQRMYVVNRTQKNHHDVEFHVLGSTGNYYTVNITNKMKCDCFDYRYRRLHCKHLLLVLARVFHVERGSPAYSKLSLTDEELQEVFANCAPDPAVMVRDDVKAFIDSKMRGEPVQDDESSLIRKSLKDDPDCPICYETLTEDQAALITFCKVCGNNVHEGCFKKWRQQLTRQGQTITCVFCRSPWVLPEPVVKYTSAQGFANFAQDSGLSFEREEVLDEVSSFMER